jgi:hypothetical protein
VGAVKRSVRAGLRVLCPLSHFFLLFNVRKNIYNIYNKRKKVGKWVLQKFPVKFTQKYSYERLLMMFKNIKKFIKNVCKGWSQDGCYSEMEYKGEASMGCCHGLVGGDTDTQYLQYECVDCKYRIKNYGARKKHSLL